MSMMSLTPDAFQENGRWFINAQEFTPSIRELAALYRVDFRFVAGKVFLDGEQMLFAIRRDTEKLKAENAIHRQQRSHWNIRHPFRAGLSQLQRGVVWLFGLDG